MAEDVNFLLQNPKTHLRYYVKCAGAGGGGVTIGQGERGEGWGWAGRGEVYKKLKKLKFFSFRNGRT